MCLHVSSLIFYLFKTGVDFLLCSHLKSDYELCSLDYEVSLSESKFHFFVLYAPCC